MLNHGGESAKEAGCTCNRKVGVPPNIVRC